MRKNSLRTTEDLRSKICYVVAALFFIYVLGSIFKLSEVLEMRRKAWHFLLASHLHLALSMLFILPRAYRDYAAQAVFVAVLNYTYNTFWQCELRVEWPHQGINTPTAAVAFARTFVFPACKSRTRAARRVPDRVHTSLFRHGTHFNSTGDYEKPTACVRVP